MKRKSKEKRIALITIIVIISIIIILSCIGISSTLEKNRIAKTLKQEEIPTSIEFIVEERLGNGFANVLIKVQSGTEIENVIFPNEDGTTLTVIPSKLIITKDIKMEEEKEYIVTVNTKDGKTTTKSVILEKVLSDFVQVGDFVNYSAGNWTEEDINKLGDFYEGENLPTSRSKLGGFIVGSSKDESMQASKIKGEANVYSGGWRVLSKNKDGTVKIIHAGTPESIYLDSSRTGSNGQTNFNIKTELNEIVNRNYSMYEDCSTNAIDTSFAVENSAHVLTKAEIGALSTSSNLKKIGIRYFYYYDTNTDNGSWPVSTTLYVINSRGEKNTYTGTVGMRPVLNLKAEVKAISNEGDTTHITQATAWNLSLEE